MNFSSHEDIEAPAQAVFAALCDHGQFQRVMQQRGIAMRRVDDRPEVGPGMAWGIDFKFRGRARKLRCLVTEVQAPERLCLSNESDGLTGDMAISVVTLAPNRSRLLVSVEMKPKNLSARLLLQSMRFEKGSLDRKFKSRLHDWAMQMFRSGQVNSG
ncbi:SRPBCC family protein [Planktomarina temperata]|nr:SRPBCC family protein [Planktomarina temperata]